MLDVFGSKPADSIFLPARPYAVRFNCQAGQLALSESQFLGKEAEISIVKIGRFFGSLGKTQSAEWLQVFYVAAPTCKILPENTVCVSYVKTRSLSRFDQLITDLVAGNQNPALGIFKISFEKHGGTNKKGEPTSYFSVDFAWRERKGKAEEEQLKLIAGFMAGKPQIIDLNSTRDMIPVDGLDAQVLAELQATAQIEANKLKPAGELLQLVAAKNSLPAA